MDSKQKQLIELKDVVTKLEEKQKQLEVKVTELEERLELRDRRLKEDSIRLLGFTLVQAGKYWHAVKTIDTEQYRVYIGRDVDDLAKVKEKIHRWLMDNDLARRALLERHPEFAGEFKKRQIRQN